MTDPTHDPVHGVRYAFEGDGENLVVDTWVEGEVRLQLGDAKRVIGPQDGEMIVVAGTKHSLASTGRGEAHLRCLVLPALGLQDFLEDSAAAAREGLFMRGGMPRSLQGARWGARFLKRHREDVVMTFPPAFVQRAMVATLAR